MPPFPIGPFLFKLIAMSYLPFARLPGINNLFVDYVENFEKVAHFYPSPQTIPESKRPHRQQLCEILERQNRQFGNSATGTLIERLKEQDTFCVITGQQVGLLTGPLYTIWKAMTAIHLSRHFESQGIPCIPVFWMATEDHNWNEIANFALLKDDQELIPFSLKEHLFIKRQPVGSVETREPEIRKILIRALQEINSPEIKNFYSEGTLTTAFAKTLLWLLKDFPMLIVNPSDSGLKQVAAPFFERFFERSDSLMDLLARQNVRLRDQNYPVQVAMEEGRLPLFQIEGNERQPVFYRSGTMPPETLSPSALLRPLYQDFLFPTLAYVGGPAEIAYFAQLHPWYPEMDMIQPKLFGRVSLTLIPAVTANFLSAKHLTPEELHIKEDTLVDALLDHEGMKKTRKQIRDLENQIQESLRETTVGASEIDPTLKGVIETGSRKIGYQLEKMERKIFLAAKRKNMLLAEQIKKAKNVVYPGEKLQERSLNIFSFRSRLPELIHQVYEQIDWDVKGHQWLYI